MHHAEEKVTVYGVVAEYDTPEQLMEAANRALDQGYTRMDAFTPFPVHGLPEAIGFNESKVPWVIFFGGLIGAFSGVGLQYWVSAIAYPHNVGGRPYFSWPSFIPVTFECMVLFAAFGAVFGMLGLNGLPKPYHPIFNTPRFERASQDLFFLAIERRDPKFNEEEVTSFLQSTGARNVSSVNQDEDGDWS